MTDTQKLPAYYGFTRPEIVALVKPDGKRVLDIGCAAGAMGGAMLAAGATEVVGIEVHAPAATHARKRLTATYQYDLEKLPPLPYPDGYFDVITFADVLEHVRDPGAVVKALRRYLRDDGQIVCSIPNIRHESVLMPLLFNGTFTYEDAGILDRTHLRFFTLVEIEKLMLESGFEVVGNIMSSRSEPSKYNAVMRDLVASAGADGKRYAQESTVVQYIFTAKPSTAQSTNAATFPNMWRKSKTERVLVVPHGDAAWQHTLASVVDHFAKNDSVTLGIPLAAADLQQVPADIERIIGDRIDVVLIEAPQDDDGWARLVAGASAVVIAHGQAELEQLAVKVGVDRIATQQAMSTTPVALNADAGMYLELMKRTLTNVIYGDPDMARKSGFNLSHRVSGRDWPQNAHTMVGLARLNNLHAVVEDVIRRGVPGHVIETGVWRGGACILMRAILKAHGVTDRDVYVCDSFEGLPPPNPELYPADAGDRHHTFAQLAVSLDDVKHHFDVYGLLDAKVKFLKGWFKDTLPTIPADTKFAVVRLDGDMYESTMDGLRNLYDKLSVGGYMIVDDYGAVAACAKAIEDFRSERGITDQIHTIDWTGVYWQRTK